MGSTPKKTPAPTKGVLKGSKAAAGPSAKSYERAANQGAYNAGKAYAARNKAQRPVAAAPSYSPPAHDDGTTGALGGGFRALLDTGLLGNRR